MISYSGLVNYGKATLPSIDSWSTDNNILRDPPKSIHTRRIDKVGDTSEITSMIDDAENRACEVILPFARGVNPSVAVSYDNNSNNGGRNGSASVTVGGQTQAYLPYRVMRDGAFRPPVVTQYDLLPLSRLPRVWTSAFTQPGFTDFSKRMKSCGTAENTKEVKNKLLKVSARPTAVYKIETPLNEPFEVKYVIQPTLKKSYYTQKSSTDRTVQNVLKPTKEVNLNNIHSFASSNMSDNSKYVNHTEMDTERYLQDTNAHAVYTNINDNRYVNNNEMDTERYLQDTNAHQVNTNMSSHIQLTSIEDILDLGTVKTKDAINIDYTAPISGIEKVDYIHDDIQLEKVLPNYSTRTNISQNLHKVVEHEYMKELQRNTPLTQMMINPGKVGETNISSRDYKLIDKIQFGGFDGRGQMPIQTRVQEMPTNGLNSDKAKMNRKIEELFSRYRN
jgi:hypothetical protein